ncbi:MAG TPA: hypothetical protein VGM87_06510 [Roseomonas sp.]
MTLRIATLFVRHGVQKYADSLEALLEQQARSLAGAECEVVVIDNALPETHREMVQPGVTLIGGSNAHWEFSAWDSGVAHFGASLRRFDFVQLVTSAFRELYNDYIALCDTALLTALRGRSLALGHIDQYNAPITLLGRRSQSWIRTSYLFLPPQELQLLGSLVSLRDEAAFFTDDPKAPFRTDAPLDEAYRQNILGWLIGAGTGQGVAWHSRFDLTAETLPRFRAKAMAILNEHALAIRLRAQGSATLDATWAARQLRAGGPLAGHALPHWQEQLAHR